MVLGEWCRPAPLSFVHCAANSGRRCSRTSRQTRGAAKRIAEVLVLWHTRLKEIFATGVGLNSVLAGKHSMPINRFPMLVVRSEEKRQLPFSARPVVSVPTSNLPDYIGLRRLRRKRVSRMKRLAGVAMPLDLAQFRNQRPYQIQLGGGMGARGGYLVGTNDKHEEPMVADSPVDPHDTHKPCDPERGCYLPLQVHHVATSPETGYFGGAVVGFCSVSAPAILRIDHVGSCVFNSPMTELRLPSSAPAPPETSSPTDIASESTFKVAKVADADIR